MAPPYTVRPPAIDMALLLAIVMPCVLPDLPKRKPPSVLSNFQPLVLKVLVKLVPAGSMASVPAPPKLLQPEVGALCLRTSVVPASMFVTPA